MESERTKYTLEQIKPEVDLSDELIAMFERSANILQRISHDALNKVIGEALKIGLERDPSEQEMRNVQVSYSDRFHETCVFYNGILIGYVSFDLVFENLQSSFRLQFQPTSGIFRIATSSNT